MSAKPDQLHWDVLQLDVATRYLALRAMEYGRAESSRYRPRVNDALDLELLFALPRPSIVCSADKRFLKLVARLVGELRSPVVHPRDLPSVLREEFDPNATVER